MSTGMRAYQVTASTPIASPGGVLLTVPPGKRAVVRSGWVSVTEIGAADDYIELVPAIVGSPNIFHAPQGTIGVYRFGPYETGIILPDGADIEVSITGATGCYAQVEYYLENTYLG